MATPGPSPRITLEAVLQVFDERTDPSEPLTASEVAEELDCTRRTAHKKLAALADRGDLHTKKPGARSRVWWRPPSVDAGRDERSRSVARHAETHFEALADRVTEYAIFVLGADGRVQSWNAGAEHIKGYTEDEIKGRHLRTFYTEADRERAVPDRNLRAAAELGSIEDEGWRLRKDGTRFWAAISLTAITDDEGHVDGYLKVTRDMTERHARKLELRREKERFESLVDEVEDYAIFMLDPDGHVTSWNQGAERIKGYTESEILGEHYSTFYTEADRAAGTPERNLERAAEQGRVEDEGRRVRQDGSTFWANVVITRLRNDDGSLRGFAKVTRDMTERRRYEQQLKRQRDELDELDRINAVIRDVDQVLVTAGSRDELETGVCTRLVDSEPYLAAWLGTVAETGDALHTNAVAGFDPTPLERSFEGTDTVSVEYDAARAALETGAVQVVQFDADDDRFAHWQTSAMPASIDAAVAIPLTAGDLEFGVLVVYATSMDVFDDRKLDVLTELGDTVGDSMAALRRKEREHRLTELHRATRDLVNTESAGELGETVVRTVIDVLGFEDAHLYQFKTDDNTLNPLASVASDGETTVPLPVLSAQDDSIIWSTFVDGTTRTVEGEDTVFTGPATDGSRVELLVPMSEHGILVVGGTDRTGVDADDRNLVELVAATAEAAFDRLESDATLRERDAILQEQNQRLQRLNQVNTVIREVDQALVQAATYEEIQRVVCERLTDTERFKYAWIGETQDDAGALHPAAAAGVETDYLETVALDGDGEEPAVVAGRTGAVQVVENVAADLRAHPWRSEAFGREFQSCIAVPLTYGDVTYGVLAVYGDRPGTFGEIEESVFEELGTTIGNAIHAVETKHALLSDRTVEVEFRLGSEEATVLTSIARETDADLTYEGSIPAPDDVVREFVAVEGGDPDEIVEAAIANPAVDDITVVSDREGDVLLELELAEDSLADALASQNTALTEFTVDPTGATVVVDVPASADVGEFIDWFLDAYPEATFVARREQDRRIESLSQTRAELADHLTDRQYEVLKTAYLSGFFDTPRQSTGGDVADTLGVSQPTVTEHLRAAQRRILDHLFEE